MQYALVRPIEHVHPLVRTQRQMKRVLQEIEQTPGIVLYTITNRELRRGAGAALHRAEDPVPCRAAADHAGAGELSRCAAHADRCRPARARRRLFPPHRRLELHHGARRRASARGSQRRRYHRARHLAHVEDPDQHLSRPARIQDGEPAARAVAAAARAADQAAQSLCRLPHRQPRSHRRGAPASRHDARRPQPRRLRRKRPFRVSEWRSARSARCSSTRRTRRWSWSSAACR